MRVTRFRKRYYILLTGYGSYPVAAKIPTDALKYQQWLAAERESAGKWEALYEDVLSVKPGNVTTSLPEVMRQHFSSLLAPLNGTWNDWIYTVDLDRETFSINNGAHYKLEQIPHIGWYNSLADGRLGDNILFQMPYLWRLPRVSWSNILLREVNSQNFWVL